ncbi:MAG: hypothetical protein WDM87_18285 [Terracidiphilus sp.]
MYNGQMIKGLIHVLIFAVLVSAAHVYGIFGLFIAGWVCYQVFEAYHTARRGVTANHCLILWA